MPCGSFDDALEYDESMEGEGFDPEATGEFDRETVERELAHVEARF